MQNLSYSALHDKLLRQYQRYVLYLCWSAVLAIFSLILYAIEIYTDNNFVGLGGTYNIPTFIALLIWDKIPEPLAIFLIFLFNAIFGAILSYLGIKARKGKTVYLFSGLGIYIADSFGLLLALVAPKKLPSQDIVLSLIVHFIVIGIILFAFYKRKQIIVLAEKQRKKMVFEDDPNASKKVLSYKKPKRTLDNKEVLADEISTSEDKIEKKEE
ncbi:MAG TPA: hypothetical protein DCY93_00330 [Firmicutes bacterium]|nr:hypothetical protein [Bacillota bacterium]